MLQGGHKQPGENGSGFYIFFFFNNCQFKVLVELQHIFNICSSSKSLPAFSSIASPV